MACEDFFKLKDTPFRLAPDPDYYFPSDVHKEALQTLIYSINAGEGFVQITGEPGTGKTLLIRTLLRQLDGPVNLALIQNPTLTPNELLRVILDDLGNIDLLNTDHLPKEKLLRMFRDMLFAKAKEGQRTIVIVDEAQQLPVDTLEELRLLSNLETEKEKLLQIILVGQVELEDKLNLSELKQLAQRITIRYRLLHLSKQNTCAYIRHRIEVAGGTIQCFSPKVLEQIYKSSDGVPRKINIICERAMMAAFVDGEQVVKKHHLVTAIKSIKGNAPVAITSQVQKFFSKPVMAVSVFFLLVIGALLYSQSGKNVFSSIMPGQQHQEIKPERIATTTQLESPEKTETQVRSVSLVAQPSVALPVNNEKPSDLSAVPEVVVEDPVQPEVPHLELRASGAEQLPLKTKPVISVESGTDFQLKKYSLVPEKKFLLSINLDAGKAYLSMGNHPGKAVNNQLAIDWPFGDGLFILGRNAKSGEFLFSPNIFYRGNNKKIARRIWKQSGLNEDSTMLPILVYHSTSVAVPPVDSVLTDIRLLVDSWSKAWRNKDLGNFVKFYDTNFISFEPGSSPRMYNSTENANVRSRIFLKSGAIGLDVSEPLCLIDPKSPQMAMALFEQDYSSDVYFDKGFKVLYLRLVTIDGSDTWRIMAKFWVPNNGLD